MADARSYRLRGTLVVARLSGAFPVLVRSAAAASLVALLGAESGCSSSRVLAVPSPHCVAWAGEPCEACNGLDDDLDGAADEGTDLCAAAGTHGECVEGTCVFRGCDASSADCNADASDGCETSLTTALNCAGCGNVCERGSACVDGSCQPIEWLVATGHEHTCVRGPRLEVWCGGGNGNGQLGPAAEGQPVVPYGIRVPTLDGAAVIRARFSYSLAFRGEIVSEPPGAYRSPFPDAPVELLFPSPPTWAHVYAAGGCARTELGVYAWGSNRHGEIEPSSAGIASYLGVTRLDARAGDAIYCDVGSVICLADGDGVRCAGDPARASVIEATAAHLVRFAETPLDVFAVDAAGHTWLGAGLRDGGEVRPWTWDGVADVAAWYNEDGGASRSPDLRCSLGLGGDVRCGEFPGGRSRLGGSPALPTRSYLVELPGPAVFIDVGDTHACASLASGGVWCWGGNDTGQLLRGFVSASGEWLGPAPVVLSGT